MLSFSRDRSLMIVCDGMGGAKSGNVASSPGRSMCSPTRCAAARNRDLHPSAQAEILRGALELANKAVYEQAQLSDDFSGMGTTLVAALILKDTAVDHQCRRQPGVSVYARMACSCVTVDHSIVEFMVQRGELTQEQAKNHPGKNRHHQSRGHRAIRSRAIFTSRSCSRDDCLLLCSDGLSNVDGRSGDAHLRLRMACSKSRLLPETSAHRKKPAALPDNVTAALRI